MRRLFRSVLLAAIAVSLASACSRETPTGAGTFANDLKGAPPAGPRAPVAKGGIADDGIKPAPIAPIAKGGVADDGVKPMPVAKGGVADDGVKPMPVAPVAKGGIPDDSIKPRIPTPLPTPAPR